MIFCYNITKGGGQMYLLSFDLIDSKAKDLQMRSIVTSEVEMEICEKYSVSGKNMEIIGGDQLRIMHNDPKILGQIIIFILIKLAEFDAKARIYVTIGDTVGKELKLSHMTGDIFYKSRELEAEMKVKSTNKHNQIYYRGLSKTEQLNLLFISYSRLVLHKPKYLEALYKSVYENKKQTLIAAELGISQSAVNNQLKKVNVDLVTSYNKVISELIEEELWTVDN